MADKYYWLRLKRDFFKRHDIRIIESMPNGKDYILFYLKLLCESVDHDGNLRFSDQIPYNEEMLSTITNTNVDIVKSAIQIFTQLQMMEIMDDGTFYMREVEKMIGSASDTDGANRVRRFRERQKELALQECYTSVTKCNESKSKSNILELDIKEKDKRENAKRFTPPTLEDVQNYCKERNNGIDAQHFIDYYSSNGWKVGKNPMKDWKAAVRTWERNGYSGAKVVSDNTKDNGLYHSYDADEFWNAAVKASQETMERENKKFYLEHPEGFKKDVEEFMAKYPDVDVHLFFDADLLKEIMNL